MILVLVFTKWDNNRHPLIKSITLLGVGLAEQDLRKIVYLIPVFTHFYKAIVSLLDLGSSNSVQFGWVLFKWSTKEIEFSSFFYVVIILVFFDFLEKNRGNIYILCG